MFEKNKTYAFSLEKYNDDFFSLEGFFGKETDGQIVEVVDETVAMLGKYKVHCDWCYEVESEEK